VAQKTDGITEFLWMMIIIMINDDVLLIHDTTVVTEGLIITITSLILG
jgi:hypothetical protein